jgi:hypothetical protein
LARGRPQSYQRPASGSSNAHIGVERLRRTEHPLPYTAFAQRLNRRLTFTPSPNRSADRATASRYDNDRARPRRTADCQPRSPPPNLHARAAGAWTCPDDMRLWKASSCSAHESAMERSARDSSRACDVGRPADCDRHPQWQASRCVTRQWLRHQSPPNRNRERRRRNNYGGGSRSANPNCSNSRLSQLNRPLV